MGSNKSALKKKRLGKKLNQNRRMPIFVMARTKRHVTRNTKARNWRHRKIKGID